MNRKIIFFKAVEKLIQDSKSIYKNFVKQLKTINKIIKTIFLSYFKMMNVRNFHLKSTLLKFNPEMVDNIDTHQACYDNKILNSKYKSSQRVQNLMKNFKITSKIYNHFKEQQQKNKIIVSHFDFDPPATQQTSKNIKYKSCTLTPRKSTEKMSSYQLYRLVSTQRNHRRGYSDGNIQKLKSQKAKNKEKKQKENQKKYYQNQRNYFSMQNNNKNIFCINKPIAFQLNNYLNIDQGSFVIHSSKNGSGFKSTLPSRKSKRSQSQNQRKFRKTQNSHEKNNQKNKNIQIFGKDQTSDQFKRSIHTAGSGITRRIDYDKLNFKPISTGFFPHSSIWNKDSELIKVSTTNVKVRSHKKNIQNKSQANRNKQYSCRPWSPIKHQVNMQQQQNFSPMTQN